MKVDFEELLNGVFSALQAIEGVKSVDSILEVLKGSNYFSRDYHSNSER